MNRRNIALAISLVIIVLLVLIIYFLCVKTFPYVDVPDYFKEHIKASQNSAAMRKIYYCAIRKDMNGWIFCRLRLYQIYYLAKCGGFDEIIINGKTYNLFQFTNKIEFILRSKGMTLE